MLELKNDLERTVYNYIKHVEDPELNISLVDLGLVYDIKVENTTVDIKMTLTSMACPAGPELKSNIEEAAYSTPGIETVNVEVVWSPAWDPKTMATEDGKMMLGIFE